MFRRAALVWTLGLPLASAEEGASPPAIAQSPADFSSGFKQLQALGLPSLEGGEWFAADAQSGGSEDYQLREILTSTKGTGWRVKIDGKEMFLPLGSVETIEMPDTGGGSQNRSFLGSLFGGGSKKPKGADLSKDVANLTAALNDPVKSKELRERLGYSSGPQSLGRLLIFAAQLHQSGHPAEANQLGTTIFSLGAPPEAIIDSAINRLAVRDHARISASFFANHDWAAYEQGLRGLVTRYPRGWDNFAAVQMLLPAVAKRVANTPVPKAAIDGITLNPDALAALDEIIQGNRSTPDDAAIKRFAAENGIPASALNAEMRERIVEAISMQSRGQSDDLWLIQDSSEKESTDPTARLKRLGIEALPVLAAVTPDETLTILPNSRGSSYHSYRSSNDSPADAAIRAYQTLERPKSRGEIASQILRSTLPGDQDESSPEGLADAAMTFWKANRGKSKLELLKIFLAEGTSSQKSIAAVTLATMTDEASRKAFEVYVLESEDPSVALEAVASYIKLHKGSAKDFFTKLSEKLKAQPEDDGSDPFADRSEIRRSKETDKYLKKLALLVGGESPRKLLIELVKSEKPGKAQVNALVETLGESGTTELVPGLVEAASTTSDLDTRVLLLNMIAQSGGHRRGRSNEPAAPDLPVPTEQIPQWTTLLADERPLPDGSTPSLHAAVAMEVVQSPGTLEKIGEVYQLDIEAYPPFVMSRARERIAGKPLPPFPDAARVPATRMEELVKLLSTAKPVEVPALVKGWSLDEKAAYQKWRADSDNRDKIPQSAIAARKILNAPRPLAGTPPPAKSLEILEKLDLKPGSPISVDALAACANSLASAAKANSGLSISLGGSPLDTGFETMAARALDPEMKAREFALYHLYAAKNVLSPTEAEAVVLLSWGTELGFNKANQIIWQVSGTIITPPEAEALQKFREAVTALDQPDGRSFGIMLSVLHREDADKVMTALRAMSGNEESEDEDE